MLIEYPSYMEDFHCVGGSCPDTCCAGWIVDVDEESYYYYQTVPGKFGQRLRKHLKEEGDAKYFPMTREKRCPFLNQQNLCDIYTELGEERLCQVCTEYPRWYTRAGYYEQQDLSLSCMEAARLFFTAPEITYERAMTADPGEGLTPEEEEALVQTLAVRNEGLEILQEEGGLAQKLKKLQALIRNAEKKFREQLEPLMAYRQRLLEEAPEQEGDSDRQVDDHDMEDLMMYPWLPYDCPTELAAVFFRNQIRRLDKLEPLNREWKSIMKGLRRVCINQTERNRTAEALILLRQNSLHQTWFTRLAMYFWFRYFLDSVLDGSLQRGYRIVEHSLQTIELMCLARIREKTGDARPKTLSAVFSVEDMMDVAHIFSKEVEHDEKNLEILQWP